MLKTKLEGGLQCELIVKTVKYIFYQKDRYASDCESNVKTKAICYCHHRSPDQQILFAATVERNTKQEGAPKDTGLLKKILLKTRDKNGDPAAEQSC